MIKAVLFDMDGTLIDAPEAICSVVSETIRELTGDEVSQEEIAKYIGRPIWEFFEELSPELREKSREASAVYRKKYDLVAEGMTRLLPHAKETLAELKGKKLKIGVVSQRPVELTWRILKYMGLNEFVDRVTSGEETRPKPSPDSLLQAMDELGVKPNETVMVGDATFDIDAAKRAGTKSIGVMTGVGTREELKKSGANVILDDLSGLNIEVINGTNES